MNRRGFVALMDAVIFCAVVMVALSALLGIGISAQDVDERDASAMLGSIMSAEVRMSDLYDGGDGSMVRVSDMCALWVSTGDGTAADYLEQVLDTFSGGRGYSFDLTFDGHSMTLGRASGTESASASIDVPVTTGGELHAELFLYVS